VAWNFGTTYTRRRLDCNMQSHEGFLLQQNGSTPNGGGCRLSGDIADCPCTEIKPAATLSGFALYNIDTPEAYGTTACLQEHVPRLLGRFAGYRWRIRPSGVKRTLNSVLVAPARSELVPAEGLESLGVGATTSGVSASEWEPCSSAGRHGVGRRRGERAGDEVVFGELATLPYWLRTLEGLHFRVEPVTKAARRRRPGTRGVLSPCSHRHPRTPHAARRLFGGDESGWLHRRSPGGYDWIVMDPESTSMRCSSGNDTGLMGRNPTTRTKRGYGMPKPPTYVFRRRSAGQTLRCTRSNDPQKTVHASEAEGEESGCGRGSCSERARAGPGRSAGVSIIPCCWATGCRYCEAAAREASS